MNGIDISRWQNIDLTDVPCDFVIVKATQGVSYISPRFVEQITQADRLGKYLGVYHYAGGGGAMAEAEHFLKTVKGYINRAILCLDWEGEQNPNFNSPTYALAFLAYIKQQTGITPFIYMSKSVCRQYAKQWDASYPLWMAQYKSFAQTGYQTDPWTDKKGYGPWNGCKIHQYSSRGRLPGFKGDLDLDLAYMDGSEWMRWASGDLCPETPVTQTDEKPLLKKGMQNEYVRAWQTFLNLNGYQCGVADGIFGNRTQAAVKAYQKAHGLKADGIIGPKTWASLPMMQ